MMKTTSFGRSAKPALVLVLPLIEADRVLRPLALLPHWDMGRGLVISVLLSL